MGIPRTPDSDLAFVARMLRSTRRGDQITVNDAERLDQIAETGMSGARTVVSPDRVVEATAGGAIVDVGDARGQI